MNQKSALIVNLISVKNVMDFNCGKNIMFIVCVKFCSSVNSTRIIRIIMKCKTYFLSFINKWYYCIFILVFRTFQVRLNINFQVLAVNMNLWDMNLQDIWIWDYEIWIYNKNIPWYEKFKKHEQLTTYYTNNLLNFHDIWMEVLDTLPYIHVYM